MRIKMLVIKRADPTVQSILVNNSDGPLMIGEETGDRAFTYACGRCDKDLLINISATTVQNLVFQCRCGAYNLSEV